MYYYKFVRWDAIPEEEAKQHPTVKAFAEYEAGNRDALKNIHCVLDDPHIDFGGWRFDFRPHLKRYWVKLRGYGINEFYALRKTDIRKRFGASVVELVEVKSNEI